MNKIARRLAAAVATLACTVLPTGASWAVPGLSYTSAINAPGVLMLNVNATGFSDLYAYQVDLVFNPLLVQATAVTEGAFLTSGGTTFFDGGTIDNVNGVASLTFDTLFGTGPGVTGSGMLESIRFSILKSGSAAFSFTNVLALDSQLNTITLNSPGATFAVTAVPEPSEISLMLVGLGGMIVLARRRRINAQATA